MASIFRPAAAASTIAGSISPRGSMLASIAQVLDWHWLDRVGEREAEDARVEVELAFQGALDVLGAAEAVLLPLEGDVGDRQALRAQRGDHLLRLVGRHDAVLEALEEDDRAIEPPGEVDR